MGNGLWAFLNLFYMFPHCFKRLLPTLACAPDDSLAWYLGVRKKGAWSFDEVCSILSLGLYFGERRHQSICCFKTLYNGQRVLSGVSVLQPGEVHYFILGMAKNPDTSLIIVHLNGS